MNFTLGIILYDPAREIRDRISDLENQYVDLFLNGGKKEVMKKVHLQLEVLKTELELLVAKPGRK